MQLTVPIRITFSMRNTVIGVIRLDTIATASMRKQTSHTPGDTPGPIASSAATA